MDKNTKNILILGAIALGSFIMFRLLKKSKSVEEPKSNLVDDMLAKFGTGNLTQVTLKNKTAKSQAVKLFNAYSIASSSIGNTEVQASPNMEFFNKTLLNEPKKLSKVKVLVNQGGGGFQSTQPMTFVCKDANGDMASQTMIPMISSGQFQANVTEIQPNVILNGECTLNYEIQPQTVVTLILEYKR